MSFDCLPPRPVISRFVAPWDTSGWYYTVADFQAGSQVYSNAEIAVTELPDCLRGCDFVVTYDSATEGFDDKQEVDFFTERRAVVYVALDRAADPAFLAGFSVTDLKVRTDAGDMYTLYGKEYAAGEHVHIDSFSGSGRHFFVVVKPLDDDEEEEPTPQAKRLAVTERHITPDFSWYVHDAFNLLDDGSQPAGYHCQGDTSVQPYLDGSNRKYLQVGNRSCMALAQQTLGLDHAEAALSVEGTVEVALDGIYLQLTEEMAILPDGTWIGNEPGGEYSVGFKRFPAERRCEIWVNDRPATSVCCDCSSQAFFSVRVPGEGMARIDRIDWRDQTDVPFFDVAWDGASVITFPAVSGEARIELTVNPMDSSFCLLPEVRDSRGEPLLRVALYANSLFISDNGQWRRIIRGRTPWNYFPYDNWYRISLALDLNRQTFDVNVDGAYRARNFNFACPAQDAAQIVLSGNLSVRRITVLDAKSSSRHLLPPGPVFDVRDYDAVGDGMTLDTAAIQRAVNAAALTNGTVMICEGVYHTKQIDLRPDMTLWVDETAVLKACQQYSAYPHSVPGENLCAIRNVGRALVYGEHLRNVRITGGGILDANGLCRFKVNDPKGVNKLYTARPNNLYIAYSRDIRVIDISLCNAAYWTLVPLSSRHILLEYLDLDCMNTPNRDGIDPVDCIDLTVRQCRIMAGDDGFCLKSADRMGCKNILAEDLVIQSLASGIKIGTDTYYGVENILVRRCILKNVNRCGIAVETVDGALIRSLTFEDIDMTDCGGPLYLTIGHRGRRNKSFPERQGRMEDITFRRLSYRRPYPFSRCRTVYESLIVGDPEVNPIRRVTIEDSDFTLPGNFAYQPAPPQPIGEKYPEYDRHGLSSGAAFSIRWAEEVCIENCRIKLENPDVRPLIARH